MQSSATVESTAGMENLINAVGKMALNFSALELMLSCHVAGLVSDDSVVGATVTCEMPFRSLLSLFDSLARYRIGDAVKLERITDLVRRLDAAEQERNKITHSVHALNEQRTEFIRIKTTARRGKGLQFAREKVDMDALGGAITKQVELLTELDLLYRDLYGEEMIKYG